MAESESESKTFGIVVELDEWGENALLVGLRDARTMVFDDEADMCYLFWWWGDGFDGEVDRVHVGELLGIDQQFADCAHQIKVIGVDL